MLRYLKDSVLVDITRDYKRGNLEVKRKDQIEEASKIKQLSTKVLKKLDMMTTEIEKHDRDLNEMAEKCAILDATVTPKYVLSDKYKKFHIALAWQDTPVKEWKCRCGWKYGHSTYQRRSKVPDDTKASEKCGTCFDESDDEDEI